MKELIQFLPAYFARNFGITLQGILFALANDASFFRALSGKKRIIKGILIFLISFNTINLLAAFSYTRLAPHITTPMGGFRSRRPVYIYPHDSRALPVPEID